MKWIGRILYFILVVLIVSTVEFEYRGVGGIQRLFYVEDNITKVIKDENYDIFDGIAHLNAAMGTYYSSTPIKNQDDSIYYDTTGENIDDKFKIKFSIYPFISTYQNPNAPVWDDGFYIVLDEYSKDVTYYALSIVAINVNDPEQKLIKKSNTLTVDDKKYSVPEFNIYTNPKDIYNRLATTTYLLNSNFYEANQSAFEAPNEYDIVSIEFTAYTEVDGELVDTIIYQLTDGNLDLGGDQPLVKHTNLNLRAETFNISKKLESLRLTETDIETYNIVTKYHPVDLSAYWSVYVWIYGIYIVLFLVIPYFWFFHKNVMASIRAKRPKPATPEIVDTPRPKEEQLFSDIEPKSDDK